MVSQDEVLAVVIDSYLEETPQLLQAMRKSLNSLEAEVLAEGKMTGLQRAAHSLKSTSAMFGATRLSQLCQELEAIAPTASSAATQAMVFQLETEYEKVKLALKKLLESLKGTPSKAGVEND
jgi:HPt (histidine-containing phosphotransfer) domain-containing protein